MKNGEMMMSEDLYDVLVFEPEKEDLATVLYCTVAMSSSFHAGRKSLPKASRDKTEH
jgi:hypothetical protein